MMPEWEDSDGNTQDGPKYKAEVFDIPVPYELPRSYYGFFEINGPMKGSLRYRLSVNKLTLGATREDVITDTFWGRGVGGRFGSLDDAAVQGDVWQEHVYGFYILWGLRITGVYVIDVPFGYAKVFPVQPKVKMKMLSPASDAEAVSPAQTVRVIKNPRSG